MKYLIVFSQDAHWIDFRYAELNALLKFFEIEHSYIMPINKNNIHESTFLQIDLPNDNSVSLILSRAVTIKAIYQIYSYSTNLTDVITDMNNNGSNLLLPNNTRNIQNQSKPSWSLQIESVFNTLTMDNKQYFRELFTCFTPTLFGPINVKAPELDLCLILDFHNKPTYTTNTTTTSTIDTTNNTFDVTADFHLIPAYFTRLVSHNMMRNTINRFDLKKRLYLG